MKILAFHAENVKKLKVIDITPQDGMVVLSGANEQGKTSALDAIQYALDGGNALKAVKKPIREGEQKAVSRVVIGEDGPVFTVTRTWTPNNSYLKVESAEGAEYKSPQAMLNKMIGSLTFDPLAFSNMKDKEQLDTLLQLVDIPIDLDAWASERKELFDERTGVNRVAVELQGQLKGFPLFPDDLPSEEVSAASVLAEQQEAQKVIDANNAERAGLRTIQEDINACDREGIRLDDYIRGVRASIAEAEERIRRFQEQIGKATEEQKALADKQNFLIRKAEDQQVVNDGLVDPDLSIFAEKITMVEETNALIRAKQRKLELQEKLARVESRSKAYTDRLAVKDKEKVEALKAAKMPIDELSFDESGVYYKGNPFNQCSSEERLRVSAAMGMALNPKLRVMFVRDGSLLDTKHRELMKQMAIDNDYQLWMEVTDDTGSIGLYFENGEITNQEGR